MFNAILVPLYTAHAEAGAAALGLANDIAGVRGGKIVVLNVVEPLPRAVATQLSNEMQENVLKQTAEELEDLVKSASIDNDSVEVVFREGHVARGILRYAQEIGAGLIVIASHDPGLADYVLGSVAAHVVRHAHCSVLVARNLS